MKYKLYLLFIITLIIFSCNTKKDDTNTDEEPQTSVNDSIISVSNEVSSDSSADLIGDWIYTFDADKDTNNQYYGMGEVSFYFRIQDNNNASYSPCYEDCAYMGTYKIEKDVLIFEGEDYSDNAAFEMENNPKYKRDRINVKFRIKASSLVTDKGEIFIKERVETSVYAEDNIQTPVYSKPNIQDVITVLSNYIFIGQKENYYVSYEFKYTGFDSYGNPAFKCEYAEFVANQNLGLTPMDRLAQSANGTTYLFTARGEVKFYVSELEKEYLILKRVDERDRIPYFKIKLTDIIRDKDGKISNCQTYVYSRKTQLGFRPKTR